MVEKVEQRHLYGQEDREVPSDNDACGVKDDKNKKGKM